MRPDVKRLLLLQTVHEETRRHHNTEVFPFLLGMFESLGWSAEWLVVHVPPEHMHKGARYVFDLPREVLSLLEGEVTHRPPDVVVFADRPADTLETCLRQWCSGVRIVDLTARVELMGMPGLSTDMTGVTLVSTAPTNMVVRFITGNSQDTPESMRASGDGFLDEAPLCYLQRTIGDEVFRSPPVRLVSDHQCPYQRPVHTNPLFRFVASDAVRQQHGCSFCPSVQGLPSTGTWSQHDQVDFALRQILAHQRDRGPKEHPCEYLWETGSLNRVLADFLRAVSSRPLIPSTFYFMSRADELLALRGVLDETLPRLAAAGHRLAPMSIGAESFAPSENQRFNKGISNRQLWDCFDMIRDLETRFPTAFRCEDWGYFSGILYTPWTRPEDLLANIEAAERLGPAWLQRMVGSRLQLWEGCAITDLAIHDGLAGRALSVRSEISAICQRDPDGSEVPWVFQDSRLDCIVRILVRLDPVPWQVQIPEDDLLRQDIATLRKGLPGGGQDYVSLVRSVVQAVSNLGDQATAGDVFRHITSEWPTESTAAPLREALETGPPPVSSPAGLVVRAQAVERPDIPLTFQIQTHQPGMNLYRRVGTLALSYSGRDLPAAMAAFGQILEAAMKRNQNSSLTSENVPHWHSVIAAALTSADLDGEYIFDVESD